MPLVSLRHFLPTFSDTPCPSYCNPTGHMHGAQGAPGLSAGNSALSLGFALIWGSFFHLVPPLVLALRASHLFLVFKFMHFFPPPYFLPNLKHVSVPRSTCSESPALLCSAQVHILPTPSSCSSLVIRDQGAVTSILLRFIRLVTLLSPQLKAGSSSLLRQFVSLGRWKGSLGVRRHGSSCVPLGKSLHSSQPHCLI